MKAGVRREMNTSVPQFVQRWRHARRDSDAELLGELIRVCSENRQRQPERMPDGAEIWIVRRLLEVLKQRMDVRSRELGPQPLRVKEEPTEVVLLLRTGEVIRQRAPCVCVRELHGIAICGHQPGVKMSSLADLPQEKRSQHVM